MKKSDIAKVTPSELDESLSKKGQSMSDKTLLGEDFVVCTVCGHKNPKNTGLCEMCSNYLFV